jgi:carbon-monoxide dehydrogenase medium subunit
MIPPVFDYHAPTSLPEALSLLQEYGYEAKILSGGHSLIPMMKLRLAEPEHLIDINNIPGLSYIREEDGLLKIGGLTREFDLETSALIREKAPIIAETSAQIADPQVRNMGTLGGNLAHGDPGNDHPATMLALGARIIATGAGGQRTIPIEEFFLDFYTTALEMDEILTEIQVPLPGSRSGGTYLKLERKVGDYATAGVAVQVTLNEAGHCTRVGLGLTNVAGVPVKVTRAESYLKGSDLQASYIEEAAQMASEDCSPSSDLRGPEAYKRAMVRELTKRALRTAAERARATG